MKLPEESELVPLVKKGASVLVLKNMCIDLVLKIQQSKNKDHLLALHNFIGSADKEIREPSQDPGVKATGIVPKSFHTWWNHRSTDWAILASRNPVIMREWTLTTSPPTHSPVLLFVSPYKSPVDLHRAHFKARE